MRSSVTVKPTTDAYAAVATATLFATELPIVRVANPTVDPDPNSGTPLSPTDPRVIAWPNYGFFVSPNGIASILGGTSLSGRFWYYEPALSKWLPAGNGFAPLVLTTGAAQGATAVVMHASRPTWFQTTAVVGAVTDLFYGLI